MYCLYIFDRNFLRENLWVLNWHQILVQKSVNLTVFLLLAKIKPITYNYSMKNRNVKKKNIGNNQK